MALVDETFRARHTLRIGGTRYGVGDEVLGSVFADEDQVLRYLRNGHLDFAGGGGGYSAPELVGGSGTVETLVSTNTFMLATAEAGAGGTVKFGNDYAVVDAPESNMMFGKGRVYAANEVEMSVRGPGALVHGDAYAYSAVESYIRANGPGAHAHGYANNGRILARVDGSTAFGYAMGGGMIDAGGAGMAFGMADGRFGEEDDVRVGNNQKAGLAFGRCTANASISVGASGAISTQGFGAIAFGYLDVEHGSNAILAQDDGAFAGGCNTGGAAGNTGHDITAAAAGSFAFGRVKSSTSTPASIYASAEGSFALGMADAGSIVASATNSMQLGHGTNAQTNSISVKGGVRINGDIPGAPRNGDIWVDGSGNVQIRSGGATKNVSTLT